MIDHPVHLRWKNLFSPMILIPLLLLSVGPFTSLEETAPSASEHIHPIAATTRSFFKENTETALHCLLDPALYFGAGTLLGSGTLLSTIGWGACHLTPWTWGWGKECLILSQLLGIATIHSLDCALKRSPLFSLFFKKVISSHSTWESNKQLLEQIPRSSKKDRDLIYFLQKRWLAKTTGCYAFLIDWIYPAFSLSVQIHPESTNSYARDPSNKLSTTYINTIKACKQMLPHPHHFPLILTRPSSIQEYLPFCFEIRSEEKMECVLDQMALALHITDSRFIIDLTSVLGLYPLDSQQWLDAWHFHEKQLSNWCKKREIDVNRILCIHSLDLKGVGGIRILPFFSSSKEEIEKHHQYLLYWISKFGLTANRIELDRCVTLFDYPHSASSSTDAPPLAFASKQQLVCFLNSMEDRWSSDHPQKTLMFKGTLAVLKDLCAHLLENTWQEIRDSPTRFAAIQLSLGKIKHTLQRVLCNESLFSFHDTVLLLEQVHADLTSLIEIFPPFTLEDFQNIFRQHNTFIPESLQPLTQYGIHSSCMTSLMGIFKALEKTLGKRPHILYGENTYFECILASELYSQARAVLNSSDEDLKQTDLLLLQFNPSLKRVNFKASDYYTAEYHVEKIAELIERTLKLRKGKPLTVAIDSTFDFSNSYRLQELLLDFEEQIASGILNIICYRSGIKFDLFGMDNYCGAPFFIIHNKDPKWSFFDLLLSDPVLQTDRLSRNWFCLVFQNAAPYLESYRKQIFDNTHAVLNRIPKRLFSKKNIQYRVIPMEIDTDPTFIDIKIFGPLHPFRGATLVGGYLTVKCLEAGFPLLFRPGIGFYHPNLSILFADACTTVRLTIGLDPQQIEVIVECLKKIDALNSVPT